MSLQVITNLRLLAMAARHCSLHALGFGMRVKFAPLDLVFAGCARYHCVRASSPVLVHFFELQVLGAAEVIVETTNHLAVDFVTYILGYRCCDDLFLTLWERALAPFAVTL